MMRVLLLLGIVFAMQCSSLIAQTAANGQEQGTGELPSIAEAVALFNDCYAVMDIDKDSIFDCLSARKVQYDPEEWSVTYLWNAAGSSGERFFFPVHLSVADTPDTFHLSTGLKPGESFLGRLHYFDHESCAITQMPHIGDQCTLWVTKEHEGPIPDHCIEHFENICGNGISLHDKDVCKDVDKSAFPDSPPDV